MNMIVSSNPGSPCVSEVLKDKLFLGNSSAALSVDWRHRRSITHVLSVCPDFPSTGPKHMNIPVEDSEYEDLLIHLPQACQFIESALRHGGRVLVHCVMGISRSLLLFLRFSRKMSANEALRFVKKIRPQAHPNYGFVKQLDVFWQCNFEPSPSHPAYRSWKRRHEQDVTYYLSHAADTVEIIKDKMLMTSSFPSDTQQAVSYLLDLGVTHLVSISPSEISAAATSSESLVRHHHFNVDSRSPEALLLALPDVVHRIHDAIAKTDGLVLVHSLIESRACTAVCAYLMAAEHKLPAQAFSIIEDGRLFKSIYPLHCGRLTASALPLFNPTKRFMDTLELFYACGFAPSTNHPVMRDWLVSQARLTSPATHLLPAHQKEADISVTSSSDTEKRNKQSSGHSSFHGGGHGNEGTGSGGFKNYISVH
ncbi:protein-tyrosine phosphatase-like protein [Gymnopilus junonius]|uniref:Protein-tyrosine phosphatase-like protein n=1 Tax=Gymnopilus junonius TaxID=109634 RepID=A0A9P5NJI6_GYMJU|nr:protein-tyrosine phosphatase-like protein [Gymnopilus junonius]